MNRKADHLNFSLELNVSTVVISIFEPFNCHNRTIREMTFVNISKATFSKNVLAAEVVCSNLKFSKLESSRVS